MTKTVAPTVGPIGRPKPDATFTELRDHFTKLRDFTSCMAYDNRVQACCTCGLDGENVAGKQHSQSGRAMFCSDECEAPYARYWAMYEAQRKERIPHEQESPQGTSKKGRAGHARRSPGRRAKERGEGRAQDGGEESEQVGDGNGEASVGKSRSSWSPDSVARPKRGAPKCRTCGFHPRSKEHRQTCRGEKP